jgi:hypothetical protein
MQPDDDQRLTRLEAQVEYLLAHLGIDPDTAAGDWSAAGPARSGALPGDFIDPMPRPGPLGGPVPVGVVPPQVADAIQRGKLIVAIKIYREMTGLPLKDAKAAVDAWASEMGMGARRARW